MATKEAEHLTAALKRFGWECGPEFEKRYVTDPWVFNLANAVDNLTYENERLRAALAKVLYVERLPACAHHIASDALAVGQASPPAEGSGNG